jgi:hypothetical protein
MEPKDYGGGKTMRRGQPQRCQHGIRLIAFCPGCDALYREYCAAEPMLDEGKFTSFTVHVSGDAALTVVEAP